MLFASSSFLETGRVKVYQEHTSMMASVQNRFVQEGRKKEKTSAREIHKNTVPGKPLSTYRRGLHPCDQVAADAAILVQTGGVLDLRKLV